eukprot:GEMP01009575.1.p1 GENE.GEMP01009575.1~~GEMP01009575.1.p1  ORF type:complete len:603 (+),score=140.30 GEMP01009575.1:125-1933(+)
MKIPGFRNGTLGLLIGASAILFPESVSTLLVNDLQSPLSAATLMGMQLLGLIALNVGVGQYLCGSKMTKMARRVHMGFDLLVCGFCVYQWFVGLASVVCLTLGLMMVPNGAPLVMEAVQLIKKSPKEILYDLQRKRTFMEKDKKININAICGRMWTYVYDVTTKELNFIQHMNVIVNVLAKRFNMPFIWCGGRIYDQNASKNMAYIDGHECFVISSSGYCAMSHQPEVLEYAIEQARKAGPNYGSYAVIGFNEQVNELHKTLQKYYQREAAMVSASGYLACFNILDALINSLSSSGVKSLILLDRYSHPCLRQGAHMADKMMFVKHNDPDDARRILREHAKFYGNRIVVIESVYSTDGDIGDLPGFRKVCDEFDCQLVVDDAHGLGVLGPNAGGVEDYWNMRGAADFICGTLSKSCSAQGGYVVSNNKTFIGALVMSPGVGFATAMNAFSAAFATKALESIMKIGSKQVVEAAMLRAYMMAAIMKRFKLPVDDTPTRLLTIRLSHPTRAMHVQLEMQRLGFLVSAMTFPAVPMHQSLLRMTIVPGILTIPVIDKFCDALEKALKLTDRLPLETNTHLLYNSAAEAEEAETRVQQNRALGLAA